MTFPVSYVELSSPDLDATREFFSAVFSWDPQPFASDTYLVAPAGERRGVDAGLLPSADGQPRCVPVINVDDLDATIDRATAHGAQMVVEPFTIPGVGRGCYITDSAGVLVGLHHNDPGV